MASSNPTPNTPTARRAFSLPVVQSRTQLTSDSQIEVLFNLPKARIVSFTTCSGSSRPGSSSGSPAVEEAPGSLEWISKLERQIARGPLRIYRAPGSVAFLSCSNALKPILPRSQCWEVDGSGKFVLQIRPPQYWRIEVPNETKIERLQVEELKDVLGKVLLFEKTPCPFQRSFTVVLPEAPQTPVKRKLWRPVERSKLETSPLSPLSPLSNLNRMEKTLVRRSSETPSAIPEVEASPPTVRPLEESSTVIEPASEHTAERITVRHITPSVPEDVISSDKPIEEPEESFESASTAAFIPGPLDLREPLDLSKPENVSLPSSLVDEVNESISNRSWNLEEDSDSFSDATDDSNITPRSRLQPAFQSLNLEPENENRPQALQNCSRSITAPPVLSLVTSPPSKQRTKSPLRESTVAGSDSGFSSTDSFHSVLSWHSPLAPPSPPASGESSPILNSTYPYPHDNIVLPKRLAHTRDVSELTATPETLRGWEISPMQEIAPNSGSMSPTPRTPTLVSDDRSDEEKFEVATPQTARSNVRHRATTSSNSRRRALSPLPAAVNLFSPKRRSRKLQTARHLPTAILQKTCEILLSPPGHLFQLMLNIASKIAAGEWRGVLSGYGDSVHWDFEDEYAGEAWTEDDYGITLTQKQNMPKKRENIPGGSWEVD